MVSFRDFVKAVGGVAPVADACGVEVGTVYKWWERSCVPPRVTFTLLRLAYAENIDLDTETVERWTTRHAAA